MSTVSVCVGPIFISFQFEYTLQIDEIDKSQGDDVRSKLPKEVQKIISLIFDINLMKNSMKEMEVG